MQKVRAVKSLILTAATILFVALLFHALFPSIYVVADVIDYGIFTYNDLAEISTKSRSDTFDGKTIALKNDIIANDIDNFKNWGTGHIKNIFEPISSFAIDFKGDSLGGGDEPNDKPEPPQENSVFLYVLYGLLGAVAVCVICIGVFTYIRNRKVSAYPSSDDGESLEDEPKKIDRPVECFANIKFTMGEVQSIAEAKAQPSKQEKAKIGSDDVGNIEVKSLRRPPTENTPTIIYSDIVATEYDMMVTLQDGKIDKESESMAQPAKVDAANGGAEEEHTRLIAKNKNIMHYETRCNGIDGFVDDFSSGDDGE